MTHAEDDNNDVPTAFQISIDRLYGKQQAIETLEAYIENPHFKEVYVDLVMYSSTGFRSPNYEVTVNQWSDIVTIFTHPSLVISSF